MTRRPRAPTTEELELWGKVAETVAPIAKPRKTKPAPAVPEATPPKPERRSKVAATAVAIPPTRPAPPKPPPALAPMDKRTRSRVSRGVMAVDRRIDLHGLTQAAAEARLKRFLRDAQDDGARVVLVITGKGSESGADDSRSDSRGVLRRMTPHWLASPTMRDVVVGFEEASRGHGGSGALYVRIRRRR
jgi:DNA-nicking Smr family endonuclease